MREIHVFDAVSVATDKFADEGVPVGYVIEDFGDGNFEVEVSDRESGETLAMFVANKVDLELVEN